MKTTFPATTLQHVIHADVETKGAQFTVKSLKTGKDYSFRLQRKEFNGRYYTHVKVEEGYRDWETDRKSTRLNSSH